MKVLILGTIASVFLCLIIIGVLKHDATPDLITVEQAISSVRSFENDSNLSLKCDKGLQSDVNGAEWRHRYYYEIDKSQSNGVNSWIVNAVTGEVDMMFNSASNSSYDEPNDSSLKTQARNVALAYAASKYNGFNTNDFCLNSEKWYRDGWSFLWVRKAAHNAITVNKVEVNVRPDMSVGIYDSTRYPLPNFKSPPKVSSKQAINAAAKAISISSVIWNSEPLLTATPSGYFYDFQLCGNTVNSATKDAFVQVSGDTGTVLSVRYNPMMPANILKKSKPTKKNTTQKSSKTQSADIVGTTKAKPTSLKK